MGLFDRLMHGWNAFSDKKQDQITKSTGSYSGFGEASFGTSAPRGYRRLGGERSIVASIYARIGLDTSSIVIRHVRQDDNDRYLETLSSGLNECLTVEANLDQAASAFKLDLVLSLLEKGTIAVVPVDTSVIPNETGSYDIKTMRVGTITAWYPQHVRVELYNEKNGKREEIVVPKRTVAIIENPFFTVMNEPNSTLQRLIRKLSILDTIDEVAGSGKIDMIIQLPYVIKSDARRDQAEKRRKDMEDQLNGSKYGVAYADGTEKIIQLNRPVENNMMKQIEYLTNLLYSQLGLAPTVFDGTADEATMINYYNRTVEPILRAIVEEFNRKFLTKTARTQHQVVDFSRDPFKLVPIANLAEIADKFTRNEILTSNEIRQVMGIRPSTDAKADMLINSNMPMSEQTGATRPLDSDDDIVELEQVGS